MIFGIGGKADDCDRTIVDALTGEVGDLSSWRCWVSWQRFLIFAANSRWNSVSRSVNGGDLARINLIGSNWLTLLIAGAGAVTGWLGCSSDSGVGRNEDKVDRDRVSGDGRGSSDEPTGAKTTPSKMSEMKPTELLGPLLLLSPLESLSTSKPGPDCWSWPWNAKAFVCLRLSGSSTSAWKVKTIDELK